MNIPILQSYITLLQNNRNYRYLWFSQVVSQFGDWFNLIAAAALVAKFSGSGLAIGGLFLARLLPPFLLGPTAGVIADRFDRRKIIIITDLLRAVVVLGFLLVQSEQQVWLIYILSILQLSLSAFFDPARSAILPDIVERKDLVTANTLGGITWSAILALGAAFGGLITLLLGATAAFILDALTFIISAWLISHVALTPLTTTKTGEPSHDKTQTFRAGLRYLAQHPAVLIVVFLKAASALAFGGMAVVQVTFAADVFPIANESSGTLGLIHLAAGLGAAGGPLLARRISGDNIVAMHWTILFTFILSFIGYVLTGWAVTLPLLLIATFIRAIAGSTNWVYSSSLIQMMAPRQFQGRIFAFDMAMMTLASAISTVWVGWAQDTLGLSPYQIALALGLIPLLFSIGWFLYLNLRFKQHPALAVQFN